jgi:hypothetical protein
MEKDYTISTVRPLQLRKGKSTQPPTLFESEVISTLEGGAVIVDKLKAQEDTNLRTRLKRLHPELQLHISNQGEKSHCWVSSRVVTAD